MTSLTLSRDHIEFQIHRASNTVVFWVRLLVWERERPELRGDDLDWLEAFEWRSRVKMSATDADVCWREMQQMACPCWHWEGAGRARRACLFCLALVEADVWVNSWWKRPLVDARLKALIFSYEVVPLTWRRNEFEFKVAKSKFEERWAKRRSEPCQ